MRQLVQQNREFTVRAAGWVAAQGVTQFIDLGCGLPVRPAVHEAARAAAPLARVAYVDHDLRSIDLYDLRLGAFAGHLVRPPATDRFDQPFIDLHYSGDGRFLIVQYRVDNEGSWGDAIYSVDPKEWEEALCLRIGRPMSARELKAFHADSKNPCRRYTAEMGH